MKNVQKSDKTSWKIRECHTRLRKVMNTKLQWMRETCNDEKESQETSYAIPCALHEKSDFFEKEYKKT